MSKQPESKYSVFKQAVPITISDKKILSFNDKTWFLVQMLNDIEAE